MSAFLPSNASSEHSSRSQRPPIIVVGPMSTRSKRSEEETQILLPRPDPELWRPIFSHDSPPIYNYEIPKPEGNHWQNILEPLLKQDKEQCDGWKDEVQNLLIFAGLFSAIVTAFVIESYQTLQADPQDAVVNILMHIASQLDNFNQTGTATPSALLTSSFSPSASSIRVNTLWFVSLILSLTVVLVGIVCLQWLREHQAYAGASPKETYALFRMRKQALQAWQVPSFFTALPLLLEASLVLFFVGIADFLWNIHHTLATWVIAVISIPLLFLVVTTSLPALQILTLYNSRCQINISVPACCPYKSPQSRILRQCISQVKMIFIALSWTMMPFYIAFFKYPIILLRTCRRAWSECLGGHIIPSWEAFRHWAQYSEQAETIAMVFWVIGYLLSYPLRPLLALIPTWNLQDPEFKDDCARLAAFVPSRAFDSIRAQSWTSSDKAFLNLRTVFNQVIFDKGFRYGSQCPSREPLYDLVMGLQSIVMRETERSMVLSAYHCFREVSLTDNLSYYGADHYLGSLLVNSLHRPNTSPELLVGSRDHLIGAIHERNTLLFLDGVKDWAVVRYVPEIHRHMEEMIIRLYAHLFTYKIRMDCWHLFYPRYSDAYGNEPIAIGGDWDLWHRDIPDGVEDTYSLQYVLLMKSFLKLAANDSEDRLIPILTPKAVKLFTGKCGEISGRILSAADDNPARLRLLALLAYISKRLAIPEIVEGNDSAITKLQRTSFFWCSSLLLIRLVLSMHYAREPVEVFLRSQPVFKTWLAYKEYIGATKEELRTRFDILGDYGRYGDDRHYRWEGDFAPFEDYAENAAVRTPRAFVILEPKSDSASSSS